MESINLTLKYINADANPVSTSTGDFNFLIVCGILLLLIGLGIVFIKFFNKRYLNEPISFANIKAIKKSAVKVSMFLLITLLVIFFVAFSGQALASNYSNESPDNHSLINNVSSQSSNQISVNNNEIIGTINADDTITYSTSVFTNNTHKKFNINSVSVNLASGVDILKDQINFNIEGFGGTVYNDAPDGKEVKPQGLRPLYDQSTETTSYGTSGITADMARSIVDRPCFDIKINFSTEDVMLSVNLNNGSSISVPEGWKYDNSGFYYSCVTSGKVLSSDVIKAWDPIVVPAKQMVFDSWACNPDPGSKAISQDTIFRTNWKAAADFKGLTFTAIDNKCAVGFDFSETMSQVYLYYSFDAQNWIKLKEADFITTNHIGDKVYFRGNNPSGFSKDFEDYTSFILDGKIGASGNVNSLIDNNDGTSVNSIGSYCYYKLFNECKTLVTPPDLPAVEIAPSCYNSMFEHCDSLECAPELPAKDLYNACYGNMFFCCTSLKEAPKLPATNLEISCYAGMFLGCSSLKKVPNLPATEIPEAAYASMFAFCPGITHAPKLPALDVGANAYSAMFNHCENLVVAPELPAKKIGNACYQNMFEDCKSLTHAPDLPATELSLTCYSEMFLNCVSLVKAPYLPAKTLVQYCYSNMFEGCINLTYVEVNFEDWNVTEHSTDNWFKGVSSKATNPLTFVCPQKLDTTQTGDSFIPAGSIIKKKTDA